MSSIITPYRTDLFSTSNDMYCKTDCYKTNSYKTKETINESIPDGLLYKKCVAYWSFDEESGTRYDSVGNYDLAAINSPAYESGIINNSAKLLQSSQQHFAFSGLDLGINGAFSICGWGKQNTAALNDNKAWYFRWSSSKIYFSGNANNGSTPSFIFLVKQGTTNKAVYLVNLCPQIVGEYFFYSLGYDGINKLKIRVLSLASGGVDSSNQIATLASGGIASSPADTIRIGNLLGGSQNLDGALDEMFILEDYFMTSDDEEYFFNEGNGRTLSEFQAYNP